MIRIRTAAARTAAVAAIIGAAGLGAAGLASAATPYTASDLTYLDILDENDITYTSSDFAIDMGYEICYQIDNGASLEQVAAHRRGLLVDVRLRQRHRHRRRDRRVLPCLRPGLTTARSLESGIGGAVASSTGRSRRAAREPAATSPNRCRTSFSRADRFGNEDNG